MNQYLAALAAKIMQEAQRNPAAVAGTGSIAGLGGGIVVWLDHATRFFQFVAVFFGAIGAVVAVLLVTPKLWRFIKRWRKNGLLMADKEDVA